MSPDVPVVANVDWQFAECARACGEILKYRITGHLSRVIRVAFTVIIASVLLIATLLALRSDIDRSAYLSAITPWSLILVLFLVFRFGGAAWLSAWQIRRNNPNMVAGMRHTISSAAYQIRWGQAESTVPWGALLKLVETKAFFLSFPMKHGAYYLPKRVLTQEQCATIRAIMQQQASDRFVQRA